MIFKKLRKFTKAIMWVIAIFIVPAFVIWNIGSTVKSRRSGYAGKLFNKKISMDKHYEAKIATRNDAWLKHGDKFEQYINLDEQIWTRLILLHEAKVRKITVSNEELLYYIKNLPIFKYAQLTPQNYASITARVFQETPAEFEAGIKGSIMTAKLMNEVAADISVSDEEVKTTYHKENEQATVSYVLIEPKDFYESVSLENEEELKNHFNAHQEGFRKPEQANVEYVEIKLERFKDAIVITDERIKKYYGLNKANFKITLPPATKSEPNKIKYKPLTEVEDSIRERLIEKEMRNRASNLARQIMNKLFSETDLAEAANAYNLTVQKTGPFSMLEEIPNVGLSFPFLKAAFSLKIGEISEVIKTSTAYYILKPLKKIKPYIPDYEEVIEEVKQAYKETQGSKLAEKKAEQISSEIRELIDHKNLSFEDAAKKLEFTPKLVTNFGLCSKR